MRPLTGHTRRTYSLPDETLAAIDEYRHRKRIGTEVEAVRRLIDAGLKAADKRAQERETRRARNAEAR